MKSFYLALFVLLMFSCSTDSEDNNVDTSIVSYHVEGDVKISKLQYTKNPISESADPRTTSPGELFDVDLPLNIEIPDYTPKRINAFVHIYQLSDREFIDRIYIKKDGQIVDETSFFDLDRVRNIGEGKYSVSLSYEWE